MENKRDVEDRLKGFIKYLIVIIEEYNGGNDVKVIFKEIIVENFEN